VGGRIVPDKILHFGRKLERARRERKIPLPEAAAALCIRRDLLSALEREDVKRFQSRAYAVGFLKTYAEYLALDPGPLVISLKKKFGPDTVFRIDPAPLPKKRGLFPAVAILFLLALGAAGAWLGWQYWQERQAAAGERASDPDRL